jgi:hypothetical protein
MRESGGADHLDREQRALLHLAADEVLTVHLLGAVREVQEGAVEDLCDLLPSPVLRIRDRRVLSARFHGL